MLSARACDGESRKAHSRDRREYHLRSHRLRLRRSDHREVVWRSLGATDESGTRMIEGVAIRTPYNGHQGLIRVPSRSH